VPIPEQIEAKKLADYLEVMTKAVFQAGASWAMIDNKWPAFKSAFANFDAKKIASFTDADMERLANDASIYRSRAKIEGTIANARTMIALDKEFGSFAKYLRSKSDYAALSKDIKKHFKYVGELSVYYFLFRVKEPVPHFEEWIETIEGDHPRMREMIDLARSKAPRNVSSMRQVH